MAFQDFDQIQLRRKQERQQNIRRRITIAILSSVAVLLVVGAAIATMVYVNRKEGKESQHSNGSSSTPKPVATAEKAVKTVCSGTDYKETCENSLMKAVKTNGATYPKDIVRASFDVVSEGIDNAIKQAKGLKFNTPLKKAAFDDCLELLNDAKEELNSSVSSIHDWGKISSNKADINNWLSAVLSYQQTCIDGFPEGPEKNALEKFLKSSKELGSNALAIISPVSSIL